MVAVIFLAMIGMLALASSGVCSDLLKNPSMIVHPPGRVANDQRIEFPLRLLGSILDRTVDTYGSYQLKPGLPMTQDRIIDQLAKGELDVSPLPISEKANQRLLPVRIPIRKGMLGWRLLLIRREDQNSFAAVRTIEDLRKFRAGFGSQWGDLNVLEKNVGEVTIKETPNRISKPVFTKGYTLGDRSLLANV